MMNYPASYSVLSEEETNSLSGGEYAIGIFDFLIGDNMYYNTAGKIQGAIWNSFSQSSTAPLVDWAKSLTHMTAFETATFAYGMFRIFRLFASYLS